MTKNKVEVEEKVNLADKIWTEIKDKKLDIFGLPDQFVNKYFSPFPADPSKLHLKYNVTSALPALETALGKDFLVELAGKYVTVSRVTGA